MRSEKFYRYTVFEDGRIYNPQGELIKCKVLKNGYTNVCLLTDDNRKIFLLHRILAHLFLGLDLKSKLTVNHKDSNKINNKLSNLEIVSQGQNNIHSRISGRRKLKVSHDGVREIKKMLELGISQYAIAEKYNVKQSFISSIKTKKQLSYI